MNRFEYCRAGFLALVLFAAACETRVTEVVLVPVSALDVRPSSLSVHAGSVDTVVAIPRDDRGTVVSVPRQVTFTSDNPTVASVRPLDGLSAEVRGAAPGTATISASLDGATGSTAVTIVPRECTTHEDVTTISVNQSFSGALALDDCYIFGEAHGNFIAADIYGLQIPVSRSLDIRLGSSQFDTYLYLFDAAPSVITVDDDSGGGPAGTDSRILATLPAGTYYIAVTSFAGNETGAYTITVQPQ